MGEKVADSFVNDVAEAEGRQEPTKQEESKEETKEDKAADSFVNDVAEAESRQEPADQRETQEDSNKDKHKSEGKPGILTVHVIEASNLRNKDIMGKSDPYVEVLFEDTKVQSQTVNNNLSPQWDFTSNFDASGDSTSIIQFNVFDADYGKDQSLGSCSISIKDAISQLDSTRWISLGGNDSGKISVKFGFTESHDQNEELDATAHAEENREQNNDLEKEQQEESKREQSTASSDSFVNDEAKGRQEPTRQEEDSKQEEAADSLVNDVAEAEGRQEKTEPEKGKIEIIGEIKDETADSFVNDVAEAEGRQEPTEQEETKEDSKEEKAADSFVKDVAEAEGRQEPTEQEESKEDSKEEKVADSFVNDVAEAEGRQ